MDDNGVPLAVIEKRRSDAMKAKENRNRIKEFVAKRPSLIERHNQVYLWTSSVQNFITIAESYRNILCYW